MSDTVPATDQSIPATPNAVDDLEGWIANREKELTANVETEPAAQTDPTSAEPAPVVVAPATVVTPEEKKVSWRDLPLSDVDDAFLKDKPAGQLWDSYKASVAAMQKAQREKNEAKSEADQLRRELEARTTPTPKLPENAAPATDSEGDEIDRLLFEDTPAARKKIEARAEERARAIAREEYQRASQTENAGKFQEAASLASVAATQRVAELYGWSEEEAVTRMKSTFPVINDHVPQYGPQLWTNPDVYIGAVQRLYGAPPQQAPAEATVAPESVPVVTPVVPNPPGSGRPSPVAALPPKPTSALSRELQDSRRVVAEQLRAAGHDIDVDAFSRGVKRKVS